MWITFDSKIGRKTSIRQTKKRKSEAQIGNIDVKKERKSYI